MVIEPRLFLSPIQQNFLPPTLFRRTITLNLSGVQKGFKALQCSAPILAPHGMLKHYLSDVILTSWLGWKRHLVTPLFAKSELPYMYGMNNL